MLAIKVCFFRLFRPSNQKVVKRTSKWPSNWPISLPCGFYPRCLRGAPAIKSTCPRRRSWFWRRASRSVQKPTCLRNGKRKSHQKSTIFWHNIWNQYSFCTGFDFMFQFCWLPLVSPNFLVQLEALREAKCPLLVYEGLGVSLLEHAETMRGMTPTNLTTEAIN